jgi:hypothetical protein
MKQLSFPNVHDLLPHNRAHAQALEKRTFRKSGGSATGVGLPVTNDAFGHAATGYIHRQSLRIDLVVLYEIR